MWGKWINLVGMVIGGMLIIIGTIEGNIVRGIFGLVFYSHFAQAVEFAELKEKLNALQSRKTSDDSKG